MRHSLHLLDQNLLDIVAREMGLKCPLRYVLIPVCNNDVLYLLALERTLHYLSSSSILSSEIRLVGSYVLQSPPARRGQKSRQENLSPILIGHTSPSLMLFYGEKPNTPFVLVPSYRKNSSIPRRIQVYKIHRRVEPAHLFE